MTPRMIADTTPELRQKLETAGYESIDDIKEAGVFQVIRELRLSPQQTTDLLALVQGGPLHASQTVQEQLLAESRRTGISCTAHALDGVFAAYRGIPPCCITEFCGDAGSGKTQLSLQLALNSQLPKDLGGVDGECLYIDTEGGLFPIRLRTMASALQERLGSQVPDVEALVSGVHVFRVYDHYELVALVRQLSTILTEKPSIKLVIIDTITFPLRLNIQNMRIRNGLLGYIGHSLVQLANKHEVAVVATNQVTSDRLNSALTPALGPAWGHWCANRVFLHRKRDRRYGYLYKSSLGVQERTVPFRISNAGVEDEDPQLVIDDEKTQGDEMDMSPWTTVANGDQAVDDDEEAAAAAADLDWDEDGMMGSLGAGRQNGQGDKVLPPPPPPHQGLVRDTSMHEVQLPLKRKDPDDEDSWPSDEEDAGFFFESSPMTLHQS